MEDNRKGEFEKEDTLLLKRIESKVVQRFSIAKSPFLLLCLLVGIRVATRRGVNLRRKMVQCLLIGGVASGISYFGSHLSLFLYSGALVEMCLNEGRKQSEVYRRTLMWKEKMEEHNAKGSIANLIQDLQK